MSIQNKVNIQVKYANSEYVYLEGLTLGLLPPTELTDEAGGVGNPLLLNTTLGGRGLSVFRRRFVVAVAVCNIRNI